MHQVPPLSLRRSVERTKYQGTFYSATCQGVGRSDKNPERVLAVEIVENPPPTQTPFSPSLASP